MNSPIRYIAFLRGINVGGNAIVKMEELAKALEELGLTHVKTFLNSGNVLFDTPETDEKELIQKIEPQLEKRFGRKIRIVLRTQEYLQKIKDEDPYAKYDLADKSLYFLVVFYSEKPSHAFTLPYEDKTIGLTIGELSGREIFLVLDRKLLAQTGGAMKCIEKSFPGLSTSRTWNTVTKLTTR